MDSSKAWQITHHGWDCAGIRCRPTRHKIHWRFTGIGIRWKKCSQVICMWTVDRLPDEVPTLQRVKLHRRGSEISASTVEKKNKAHLLWYIAPLVPNCLKSVQFPSWVLCRAHHCAVLRIDTYDLYQNSAMQRILKGSTSPVSWK